MRKLISKYIAHAKKEDGMEILEFAGMAAIIAIAISAAALTFGGGVQSFFTSAGDWATQRGIDMGS